MRWSKWLVIPILLGTLFFTGGCGSSKELIKLDKDAYKANKALAIQGVEVWSFNSGAIQCSGAIPQIANIKITSIADVKPFVDTIKLTIMVADMDALVKRLNKWDQDDYDLGCSLGIKAGAGGMIIIDMIKLAIALAK